MEAEADDCAVCLCPLTAGGLHLHCGHAFHASCVLATFQDEPMTAWRCPCCRSFVDLAGVVASAELPPEAHGRQFYSPHTHPANITHTTALPACHQGFDLESGGGGGSGTGSRETALSGGSSSRATTAFAAFEMERSSLRGSRAGGKGSGLLVAVDCFMAAAGRALKEEACGHDLQPCSSGSGSSSGSSMACTSSGTSGGSTGAPTTSSSSSRGGMNNLDMEAGPTTAITTTTIPPPSRPRSSWVLRTVERLLPDPAVQAAAVALASLRLRQLLHPKEPSLTLTVAAALWFNAAALLAGGLLVGVLLLGWFMRYALLALCHANMATAAVFGLRGDCLLSLTTAPLWMLLLLWACGLLAVFEIAKCRTHGKLFPYLLRLDQYAPRILMYCYTATLITTINVLLLSYVFNLGSLLGAWLLPTPDAAPFAAQSGVVAGAAAASSAAAWTPHVSGQLGGLA